MHISRLAKSIVGVERIEVRGIAMDGAGALAIGAEPYRAQPCRCGKCGRGAPRCDAGRGVRLWRCCDAGGMKAHVRSEAFRAPCPECGTAAREVPWAAHGPRSTHAFEGTCCRCALSMGRAACQKLMRVSWRTVGSICPGAEARLSGARPPVPGGLVRTGVDETSCRKGCKCMTAIVDHGTGAAVWCHDGHGKEAFGEFLPGLTEERRASIEPASADGARWAGEAMAGWLPGAAGCIGTFHAVQRATDLLDEDLVREGDEEVWADAGYVGAEGRAASDAGLAGVAWHVAKRRSALSEEDLPLESAKSAVRCAVEHVFHILKDTFGIRRTRLKGLAKVSDFLAAAIAAAGALIVRRGPRPLGPPAALSAANQEAKLERFRERARRKAEKEAGRAAAASA